MRMKIAFLAGLCLLIVSTFTQTATAQDPTQCFICEDVFMWSHKDGCEEEKYAEDLPSRIHIPACTATGGSCYGTHGSCSTGIEGYNADSGTLLAVSECSGEVTSIALT